MVYVWKGPGGFLRKSLGGFLRDIPGSFLRDSFYIAFPEVS